ncbi:MAG: hypothetical protein ACW964_02090 [Candidatus Hodarchaeales archaeon]
MYQYAILWHPNKDEEKKGKKSKIVVDPTTILASDERVAQMIVIKAIPEEYEDKLEQLDVAIRPF